MSRILELYRRAPDWSAFMLAATVSSVLAVVTGIAGAVAGVYLYDRGRSKGDDLAVLIIGVLAVGAFAFVVLLTWLRTLHHKISSRTPFSARRMELIRKRPPTVSCLQIGELGYAAD